MAGWTKDHKVTIIVGVLGALALIIAAVITGLMASDSNNVDQKTGGDGTVCINSQC